MTYRSRCTGHRGRRLKRGKKQTKTFDVAPGPFAPALRLVEHESRVARKRPHYRIVLRLEHGLYHHPGTATFDVPRVGRKPVDVAIECRSMVFDKPDAKPIERWSSLRDGAVIMFPIYVGRGARLAVDSAILVGVDPLLDEVPYFQPAADWLRAGRFRREEADRRRVVRCGLLVKTSTLRVASEPDDLISEIE